MLKHQIVMFIINVIIGIALNPMNLLAYRFNDLYFSLTLFYGGLAMASNMIWSHEIIKFIVHKKFNFQIIFLCQPTNFFTNWNSRLKT